MGHKVVDTTHNSNNAFGPGTANEHKVKWWFKKFCKGNKSLEDKEWPATGSWQQPIEKRFDNMGFGEWPKIRSLKTRMKYLKEWIDNQ